MSILYALVARGTVVLSEFSATSTNANSIAKQILEKLPGNEDDSHVSYSQDRYVFHVKRTDGLSVLCMADETAGRSLPFAFLEDVHQRFVKTYGRAIHTAQAYSMNDEFSRVLSQQLEYFSNDPNADRISRIKGEMTQVRNVMVENIDKVLDRGERLDLLVDKTENMQGNTFRFRKQARQFRSVMWWRNVKLTIALIFILSVVIYIAMAFVCHGPNLPKCFKDVRSSYETSLDKTRSLQSSPNRDAMKRKWDEKQDSESKLDPIPVELTNQSMDSLGDGNNGKDTDTSESELDSLPLELKLAILTRLPAKSLSNFRCVSKTWSSIIRNPDFVRSFFSISSKQPRFIVALSNGICNPSDEKLVFLFSFSTDSSLPTFEMAIPSVTFGDVASSCTSLHGLLTLEADGRLIICNPSTEQSIALPWRTSYVGYDPINDQYKAFVVRHKHKFQSPDNYLLEHKVLTFGQDTQWRDVEPMSTTPLYSLTGMGISIDGFIYYGAYSPTRPFKPGIVCFDVRHEKLTYVSAPSAAVYYGHQSTFMEYKGKFASIVRQLHISRFQNFDLWVLEDVHKHRWSVKSCVIPLPVWDFVEGHRMCFPGTNKAGEIIMVPTIISTQGRPFYIFYYNVETHNVTGVRLPGIGDNQDFMHSYGFIGEDECHVRIAPQHVESIHFFNNPLYFPTLLR